MVCKAASTIVANLEIQPMSHFYPTFVQKTTVLRRMALQEQQLDILLIPVPFKLKFDLFAIPLPLTLDSDMAPTRTVILHPAI